MDYAALQASIINHERTGPIVNSRFMPYKDSRGFLTLGYGQCIEKTGISQSAALFILNESIQEAITQAKTQSWWPSVADNDARSRAMTEMVFEMGAAGVLGFVHALSCLSAGDYAGAADAFLQSQWARQTGQRAVTLAAMIKAG